MPTKRFGITLLLCSLLVAPAAYAHRDADNDGDGRNSDRHHHHHHGDSYEIQRKRAKLQRDYQERKQALWAYNEARRRGDWATVRFEQARLERLDRQIRHDQHELERAYEKSRRDRHEHHGDRRDRYGYDYNRY